MRTGKARQICANHHAVYCAICGLTQMSVLDVAHLDNQPGNDEPDNLAWLCKTHHRMLDCGLYPMAGVKMLRDHWTAWHQAGAKPDHGLYIKDGAIKAAKTRRASEIARRAAATRAARKAAAKTLPDTV
ncbi:MULTISPECIES: HNH endonuclease [unclassified Azospirillum]|uniref:HNH endonuclease signature motif containing protein n=1 Tax=unclassified Azospirillum TaxID=2630922 RepID=UPI000B6F2551|nr:MULTISPECIES: HNH endonuclease [unclassified Azospirillum]SNT23892.1 hypothetical protein SAMN05880556_1451 [Azospirillum sp. RU38E]SNT34809.1 hypothetical protein SAMN05880591_1441 [Azospirillum sp. RU37A]